MMKLVIFVVAVIVLSDSALGAEKSVDYEVLDKILENCKCITTYEYVPVCGSDRASYPNNGALECVKKCSKPDLNKAHDGLCHEQPMGVA